MVAGKNSATPLAFEPNQGQSGNQVQYLSRGGGGTMLLTSRGAVLNLRKGGTRAMSAPSSTPRRKLLGASTVSATGQDLLPDVGNYLVGSYGAKWRTGVERFARGRHQGVYPGIDLVYYGKQRQLEYDFVVAPGAAPPRFRLEFDGVKAMRLAVKWAAP